MALKILDIQFSLGSEKIKIEKLVKKKNLENIKNSTGIPWLYRVRKNEDIISMSLKAARKIFKNKKKKLIDTLILVTQTPKTNIPPNSFIIHKELKLSNKCMVFDVNQGCSGYVYALSLANSLIASNQSKKILIITADNYSRYCKKLNVNLLFSDAATASIIEKASKISLFDFLSIGDKHKELMQDKDNYSTGINYNSLIMNGSNVFNFTINENKDFIKNFIRKNNLKKKINFVILHQASKIVNDNLQRNLGLNKKFFLKNYNKVGNTVSSSIPILLKQNQKKLKNKRLLISGFGVGLSTGVCYLET
jgi:3-oxoacyl-[acyl-carrier-protein] synthase-3